MIPGTIEAMTVTLTTAIGAIKAETIVASHDPEIILSGAFAADLMSDVLAFAREGSLLITGLNTDQTIRTAAIKHLIAVVLIQGKEISPDMLEAAREEGIALYQTPLSKYETCAILVEAGLRPYRSQAELGQRR